MEKLKLCALALAAFAALPDAEAASWTSGQAVGGGEFYLYNIGTGMFLNAGDPQTGWGTHAYLNSRFGYKVTLAGKDGAFTIKTPCSNGGSSDYLTKDMWSDGKATTWTFTPVTVDGYTNVYTISIDNAYITGASTREVKTADDATSNNAHWLLISKQQLLDNFKNATESEPVDASFLLTNPEFQRNFDGGAKMWPHTNNGGNVTVVGDQGSQNNYYGCEFWNNTFDIHQTVTGLPAGKYKVSVDGFGTNGTTYIYANDASSTFAVTSPETSKLHEALANIAAGKYETTYSPVVTISDGNLTCGIKRETNKNSDWAAFDNFYLYYVGQISSAEIQNAYITAVTTAKETANKTDKMSQTAKTALTEAINAYGALDASSTDDDALKAATENLNNAVTNANSSIAAYASAKEALAARAKLVASTNFYTDEALKAYYTDPQTAWENSTLSDADAKALVNPYTVTGWRANEAAAVRNLLGSATGITDYADAPYVNTWSIEGSNDGSNFVVPFFEYWTGNGAKLAAKTLTLTKTGLEAGTYKVSARVRVRLTDKETAPVTGFSMNVNGGNAKAITGTLVGTESSNNMFYLDNYTAYGTVGDDGTLKLNIVVADGANGNWISFQNVKYEKVTPVEYNEAAANTITDEKGAYVTMKRTIVKDYWNTFVVPFDLSAEQVKAAFGDDVQVMAYANTEGNTLNFTKTDVIKANKPVLVKADANTELTFEGVNITDGTPTAEGTNWNFVGTFNSSTTIPANAYMLQNNYLYKSNGTANTYYVNAFRGFFEPKTTAAAKPILNIDGTTTGIDKVVSDVDNDGNVYNLAGQKVGKSYKGVLIKNGKKYMNK